MGLGQMFLDCDFALLEINPLVITAQGNLHCLDGKINIDAANALYRQPKLRQMRTRPRMTPAKRTPPSGS
ncbi:hypothetical protein ACNKHX_03560 [Shigella flexneri]